MPRSFIRDLLMAACAQALLLRREVRVLLDVRLVHIGVAVETGGAALEVALALPEGQGFVREAPGASVGPIGGIVVALLRVFEKRREEVVVVLPARKTRLGDVPKRVALRAQGGAGFLVDVPGMDDGGVPIVGGRLLRRVLRGVNLARTMAPFAARAEVRPRGLVGLPVRDRSPSPRRSHGSRSSSSSIPAPSPRPTPRGRRCRGCGTTPSFPRRRTVEGPRSGRPRAARDSAARAAIPACSRRGASPEFPGDIARR